MHTDVRQNKKNKIGGCVRRLQWIFLCTDKVEQKAIIVPY